MGKISRYLVLAVIVGVAIIGFWAYQKYFKDAGSEQVLALVELGDLEEIIRVQGEVVPVNEYNLEFATPGIVSNVYVKEGSEIVAGTPLMKLNTSELVLEKEQLDSLVAQRVADLAKLTAGATTADIAVYQAKESNAVLALRETEKTEQLALRAVFTAIDDAVRGTTDMFYSNTNSQSPQLSFSVSDSNLENALESERASIEALLSRDATLASSASSSDLHATALQMQADAQRIGVFLDNNAKALSTAVSSSISVSTIQSWQASVAAARSALNVNVSALAVAEQSRAGAVATLLVTQKELALKQSPPRIEDIQAAKAILAAAESQVGLIQEKIRKATIFAPEKSRVVHVAYKVGEAVRSGSPAVTLNGLFPEVESDVSELDIARVENGAEARISFDALPGTLYDGKVITIDPQKKEKDGDTYYRVNFSLTKPSTAIRSGMTAEVLIKVSEKKHVLKIHEYATYERGGVVYARVLRDNKTVEVPVTLGISDGEYREVVSGLSEGDQVVVPLD